MFLGHTFSQKGEDYNCERTDSLALLHIVTICLWVQKNIPKLPDVEGSPLVSLEHFSINVGEEWNEDLQSFWFEVRETNLRTICTLWHGSVIYKCFILLDNLF